MGVWDSLFLGKKGSLFLARGMWAKVPCLMQTGRPQREFARVQGLEFRV